MWRTKGVLLMDEVDLLLHPLKSELNFPIGAKIEIDVDVETLGVAELTANLKGGDGLVIAVGFVPGNPFKMTAAAQAVDNVGTVKLIDAAKVNPNPNPQP